MSGNDTPSGPPSAYAVTSTPGGFAQHSVTIAPDKLDAAVATYKNSTAGKSPVHIAQTLQSATGSAEFGSIPHSSTIGDQVRQFLLSHIEAMHQMGGVLDDFVARVQAAAQLGREGAATTQREVGRVRSD